MELAQEKTKLTESKHTIEAPQSDQAAEKSSKEKLQAAVDSKNAEEALNVIQAISDDAAEMTSLASETVLLQQMAKKLKDGDTKNACMDAIYSYISDEPTMEVFIKERFDVTLGTNMNLFSQYFKLTCLSDKTEVAWTIDGSQAVYRNYLKIPASQLKAVNNITRCDESVGGVALAGTGTYNVDYNEESKNDGSQGWCHSSDIRVTANHKALDSTIIHELGHLVDGAGYKYSSREDFRKLSGWKEVGKSAGTIVSKLEEYCPDPYSASSKATTTPEEGVSLTNEEKEIAHEAAIIAISKRKYNIVSDSSNEMIEVLQKAYSKAGKTAPEQEEEQNWLSSAWKGVKNFFSGKSDNKDYRSIAELAPVLKATKMFQHISRAFTYDGHCACYTCGLDTDFTTQLYETYTNRGWYSFNNKAWNPKISRYQFRAPWEEFAELYATYHYSNGADLASLPDHKKWFEDAGLNNADLPQSGTLAEGENASDKAE